MVAAPGAGLRRPTGGGAARTCCCTRFPFDLVATAFCSPAVPLPRRTLPGASRMHKNANLVAYAAREILKLEPDDQGARVLLSNTYADLRQLTDAEKSRKAMRDRGIVPSVETPTTGKPPPAMEGITSAGDTIRYRIKQQPHLISQAMFAIGRPSHRVEFIGKIYVPRQAGHAY